jgi:hypothetical protein
MPSFIQFQEIAADLGAPLIDGEGARTDYREGYFICAREAATALRLRRDARELRHGVGGVRLDLEPDTKAGLRRPNVGHRGPAVARDHQAASPRAVAAALRKAAMFDR